MWVETDHGPDTKGLLLITDVPLKGSLTIRKVSVIDNDSYPETNELL